MLLFNPAPQPVVIEVGSHATIILWSELLSNRSIVTLLMDRRGQENESPDKTVLIQRSMRTNIDENNCLSMIFKNGSVIAIKVNTPAVLVCSID